MERGGETVSPDGDSALQGRLMRHRSALRFGAQQQALVHMWQPDLAAATSAPPGGPARRARSMAARMRRMNPAGSFVWTPKAIMSGPRGQPRSSTMPGCHARPPSAPLTPALREETAPSFDFA
jgi:hypothetical protein